MNRYVMHDQTSLFGPNDQEPGAATDEVRRLRVMVTVKAAPNPSEKHGETVCVAGVSADLDRPGWIRLYPINFRYLEQDKQFSKYDILSVDAVRARSDVRHESWNPRMSTLTVEKSLPRWPKRRGFITPYMETSMCGLRAKSLNGNTGPSLGIIRPRSVDNFVITAHPGWSRDEQAKIDRYVNQLDLLSSTDRTPLDPPRFRGTYHWRCHDPACNGHEQGNLDWEWVAFQRRERAMSDAELTEALRAKFLDELCGPTKDVAFYVGNQAKRHNVFSVLGVWWPPRRP